MTVKKHPRDGYGDRLSVHARYTIRLRNQMQILNGRPLAAPILTNPRLTIRARFIAWTLHSIARAAWQYQQRQQPTSQPPRRKIKMAAAHDIGQQELTRRPYSSPEAWITGAGLPQAVNIMPARAMSREADVQAPLEQMAISGGVVLLSAWSVMAAAKYFWNLPANLSYLELIIPAGLLAILVGAVSWFGMLKKNRINMYAFETAVNMDIDGDGQIGEPFTPRAVPVHRSGRTDHIAMPEKSGGLYTNEWQQIAIALLIKRANVSRRGITDNTDLSQSKASEALAALNKGYAANNKLNRAGYDLLLPYLPDYLEPTLPRP